MSRPKFTDLTPEQQAKFGNGVGPDWLSDRLRKLITETASWFFDKASWKHHDFGYVVGGDRWDRARCDRKFYAAMLKDAMRHKQKWFPLTVPIALILSTGFYVAVRIGGQFGSFAYRKTYASLEEVLSSEDAN